jgi:hypothetical protein
MNHQAIKEDDQGHEILDPPYGNYDEDKRDAEEESLCQLSAHVKACYDIAKNHRQSIGIDDRIRRNKEIAIGEQHKNEIETYTRLGVNVSLNIVGSIIRSFEATMRDIYVGTNDVPWVLEPTPIPELSAKSRAEVIQAVQQIMASAAQGQTLSKDSIRDIEKTAKRLQRQKAEIASKAMSELIKDQFLEGGFPNAFDALKHDIAIYPNAYLRGPVLEEKRQRVWNEDKFETVVKPAMVIERLAPEDFYPSPDGIEIDKCEYIVARLVMNKSAISQMRDHPTCSKDKIEDMLERLEAADSSGDGDDETTGIIIDSREKSITSLTTKKTTDTLEIYDFWGRVSGFMILDWLVNENKEVTTDKDNKTYQTRWGEIDGHDYYEINAWLCEGEVIRLLLNPNSDMVRPYHKAPFQMLAGEFYGRSAVDILAPSQAIIDSLTRSLVMNAGHSSAPIILVNSAKINVAQLVDENNMEQEGELTFKPWGTYDVTDIDNSIKPVQFNSYVDHLMAAREKEVQNAHTLIGIPPYTYGEKTGMHSTLGGVQAQFQSANKGIKDVVKNIDLGVLEPLVTAAFLHNMEFSNDESIKADAKCRARGSEGLFEQEQRAKTPEETLKTVGQFLMQVAPNSIPQVLSDYFTGIGKDPKDYGLPNGLVARETSMLSNQGQGASPQKMAGDGVPNNRMTNQQA